MVAVRGKWAAGIPPRNFTWVIRDQLAISERPGGFSRNHRPVRRQEEIIWLRVQGFTRVVSILPSPHNLHAYDDQELPWSHIPFAGGTDARAFLRALYRAIDGWIGKGDRLLLHEEELGDRLMGVAAGYLLWSRRLPGGPEAIMVLEQITRRQMGPAGRELVALAGPLKPQLPPKGS
ncbi:MAG: hypothetical protein M1115_02650 [Actinobacteria bacterium]|nr:hypothetical protein [Actinomycetota bacterium]